MFIQFRFKIFSVCCLASRLKEQHERLWFFPGWGISTRDGSWSKFFDPGLVGSTFCGSGQVIAIFGLGLIWKISPKNTKFFNIFPSDQKNLFWSKSTRRVKGGSTSYLLRVKSKRGLGWVRAHLLSQHL